MVDDTSTGMTARRARSAVLTTAVGLAMLLCLAAVFSMASGTRRITSAAIDLHSADEALRQATTVRAHVALSVVIANVDRTFGTHSPEALATSREEMLSALDEFTVGVDLLGKSGEELGMLADIAARFEATTRSVVDHLDAGEAELARTQADEELDGVFRDLQAELVHLRATLNSEVQRSDEFLAWLGTITRFLVAFLVPAAVVFIYRELARRQQQQAELEGKLQAEQALGKAREDFIANASHELRTPLTSIYGMALILDEDESVGGSETAGELVNLIISEAADLSRMVEDLLTTARLDAGALHYSIDDHSVEEEVDEVVGSMSRSGGAIAVDVEPGVVRVDKLRLRQILRNLLSNARKYGGDSIRLEGRGEAGWYSFVVADDGPGIPKEMEEKLFSRFVHQGREQIALGSVGLGLSIVQALAEGMGGAVGYERTDGWTRFSVALPLVGAPRGMPRPAPGQAALLGGLEIAASEEHRAWG